MRRPLETLQQMRPNEEARPEPIVRERRSPCIPLQNSLHGVHEHIQHLFNKQVPVSASEHELMQTSPQEELEAGENMRVQGLEECSHRCRNDAWPDIFPARCRERLLGK